MIFFLCNAIQITPNYYCVTLLSHRAVHFKLQNEMVIGSLPKCYITGLRAKTCYT